MEKLRLIVYNRAAEGRADELDAWFNDRHLADVLAIPGVVALQRFELCELQLREPSTDYEYAVIVEIETEDVEGVLTEWRRRIGTPEMPSSDASVPGLSLLFRPMTERVVSSSQAVAPA